MTDLEATSDRETDANVATPWGRGLVLFPKDTAPAAKRRRLVAVAIMGAVALAQLWPIYPQVASIERRFLGLPFSLAWVVMGLVSVLLCLAWLFRHEDESRDASADGGA